MADATQTHLEALQRKDEEYNAQQQKLTTKIEWYNEMAMVDTLKEIHQEEMMFMVSRQEIEMLMNLETNWATGKELNCPVELKKQIPVQLVEVDGIMFAQETSESGQVTYEKVVIGDDVNLAATQVQSDAEQLVHILRKHELDQVEQPSTCLDLPELTPAVTGPDTTLVGSSGSFISATSLPEPEPIHYNPPVVTVLVNRPSHIAHFPKHQQEPKLNKRKRPDFEASWIPLAKMSRREYYSYFRRLGGEVRSAEPLPLSTPKPSFVVRLVRSLNK